MSARSRPVVHRRDIFVVVENPAGISGEIRSGQGCRARSSSIDSCLPPRPIRSAYGFIPGTLAEDGDPADALVLIPTQVVPGAVIRAGRSACWHGGRAARTRRFCVPHERVHPQYAHVDSIEDLPPSLARRSSTSSSATRIWRPANG